MLSFFFLFRLHISDLIAFTATQLQPSLTIGFILAHAQQVLIERFNFIASMRKILPTTAAICRHTDIVHICPHSEGKHKGTRYVWVHLKIRPWGQELPIQCPKCACIRTWLSTREALDGGIFACEHCGHRLTFSAPQQANNWLGGAVFGGRWLVVEHLA